jgi:hypothetical protein
MIRFPIAGLRRDQRPALWAGDFDEVRDSGLAHHAHDIFVVGVPDGSLRYRDLPIVSPVDGAVLEHHPRVRNQGDDSPVETLGGAGFSSRGGNYVWILGDDGLHYYFAHMTNLPLVRSGERVRAGQQIGLLGDSGNAHGRPHLHFTTKKPDGTAVRSFDRLKAVEATAWSAPIAGFPTVAKVGLAGAGAVLIAWLVSRWLA